MPRQKKKIKHGIGSVYETYIPVDYMNQQQIIYSYQMEFYLRKIRAGIGFGAAISIEKERNKKPFISIEI